MLNYKRPVKLTDDFLVIDADGKTLLPDITWKRDFDHKMRQRELGMMIVEMLNAEMLNANERILGSEMAQHEAFTQNRSDKMKEIWRKRREQEKV